MSTLHAEDGPVVLRIDADVAVISLNRPHRLNAVNDQLVEGLLEALSEIEASDCGAALLTGRGRAFCAGHDLKEPRGDDDELLRRLEHLQDVTRRIRALPIPVIAAVHGHAVGAGAEFALGCDLVVAAEGTRFRFPEVGLGLSVTGGVTKLLPLLVGPVKAKELVLLGEAIDAHEAMRLGLVNRVVPPSELTGATMDWAPTTGQSAAGAHRAGQGRAEHRNRCGFRSRPRGRDLARRHHRRDSQARGRGSGSQPGQEPRQMTLPQTLPALLRRAVAAMARPRGMDLR